MIKRLKATRKWAISFSDNLQKLNLRTLCVAMVTDMTSQVPTKYSPAIELQGDI